MPLDTSRRARVHQPPNPGQVKSQNHLPYGHPRLGYNGNCCIDRPRPPSIYYGHPDHRSPSLALRDLTMTKTGLNSETCESGPERRRGMGRGWFAGVPGWVWGWAGVADAVVLGALPLWFLWLRALRGWGAISDPAKCSLPSLVQRILGTKPQPLLQSPVWYSANTTKI